MPAKCLVLGLGNRLSGADGFGPAVVERLALDGDLGVACDLADVHTDLLGSLHRFEGRDDVVIVDAVLARTESSHVSVVREDEFTTWNDRSTGAHGLSAVMAVKLFRRLQPPAGPGVARAPIITLVAYFVPEDDFHLPLAVDAVAAGAKAVRSLIANARAE